MPFLSELLTELEYEDIEYTIIKLEDRDIFPVTRPDNSSMMIVDAEKDTLSFLEMNSFTQKVGQQALVTVLNLPEADEDVDEEFMIDLILALMEATDENPADSTEDTDFDDFEDFEDVDPESLPEGFALPDSDSEPHRKSEINECPALYCVACSIGRMYCQKNP